MTRHDFDIAVIGAGIAGLTASLLLASHGFRVAVFEAHTQVGGCAGFFRRGEFSFDVGATTFIGFQPGGVGWQLAEKVGLGVLPLERIRNYTLCLPDRQVPIRSQDWSQSWADSFPELGGQASNLFASLGGQADKVWSIAGRFPSFPLCSTRDVVRTLASVRLGELSALPWLFSTFGNHLRSFGPLPPELLAAFNMLLLDTTQSDLERTPTAYALLGLTLMRHGLFRPRGSTAELWRVWCQRLESLGSQVKTKHRVSAIESLRRGYRILFHGDRRAPVTAAKLVSAIPVWNTFALAPQLFQGRLEPYLGRRDTLDGAFSLYVGVRDFGLPRDCLHFQVLRDWSGDLSDGTNLLLSLSGPDEPAAPPGFRSVTISCHTEPTRWESAPEEERVLWGGQILERFLNSAESLFPGFGEAILKGHFYPASPLTYRRFTSRYRGMAGYQGLTPHNCLWRAIPRRFGRPDFWQIGDTGFPGAGTVACMVSGFNAYKDITDQWL